MILGVGGRRSLLFASGLVALLGAAGLTEAMLFHQASTLKYVLTIVAPLAVGLVAASPNPLAVIAGLLVVAAPFAGYSMTYHSIHVPLLAPILIGGFLVAGFAEPQGRRRSALATGGLFLLVTLVVPIIDSPARTDVLGVLVSLFGAAWFAARACSTRQGFLTVVWAFAGSVSVQALLAIWENVTHNQLDLFGQAGSQTFGSNSGYFFGYIGGTIRPPGAFYDPISLGNVLAIGIPLSLGLVTYYARRGHWRYSCLAFAAFILAVAGLEVTLSRMSWIAAVVAVLVAGLLLPRRERAAVLSTLALVVVLATLLGAFGGRSPAVQRLSSITHPLSEAGTAQGDVIRVDVWQRAIAVALKHPAAGVGFGRFGNVLGSGFALAGTGSQAQSTYLQLAAEGGALAIVGLVAVLAALGRDLVRILRTNRLWGAVLVASSVAMLICWLTDVTIRYSGVAACMGTLFGLVAGVARFADWQPDPWRRRQVTRFLHLQRRTSLKLTSEATGAQWAR
jgi:hypothetical protein